MTLPGYGSTGRAILQDALTRAGAGEPVDAAGVLDQLDAQLSEHMGRLSTDAHKNPQTIVGALHAIGYRTPHEVLAAASGVVGSAVAQMSPADARTWLDVLLRAAQGRAI